jgi:hypothetical protein
MVAMPRAPLSYDAATRGRHMIENTVGKSLTEALSRISVNGILVGITLFVVGVPMVAALLIAALRNMAARGSSRNLS